MSEYEQWWSDTWGEREHLLRSTFGDTEPSDTVSAFEWNDIDVRIPGACALAFKPSSKTGGSWLTITHGLTQPLTKSLHTSPESPSGLGYEFGVLTQSPEPWVVPALGQLLTYVKQSQHNIFRGDRVPIWFENASTICFGKPPAVAVPSGEMRAWLFWPFMRHPGGFDSRTGYFSVLIGTLITKAEWDLAKAYTSTHVLLLLFRAGVGQISNAYRECVTNTDRFQQLWTPVSKLSERVAGASLLEEATGTQL